MSNNEKTAPDVSGIKGGMVENEHAAAFQIPIQKNTTTGPEVQEVTGILPHGEGKAVSSAKVMRLRGLSSIRQCRATIAENRAVGALIALNTTGAYYLPVEAEQGWEELRHFGNNARSKARVLLSAARPVRAALRVLDGQEQLDDYAAKGDSNDG